MNSHLPIGTFVHTVMRITLLQMLLGLMFISITMAHDGEAQDIFDQTVTLRVNAVQLEQVLAQIESQTNVKFVFSSRAIGASRIVTANVLKKPLLDVLNGILKPLQIYYRTVGGRIILTPSDSHLLPLEALPINVVAPAHIQRQVSGVVRSAEENKPLPGVNVVIRGNNRGATTDAEGRYTLTVPDGEQVLVYSSIGFVRQEIKLSPGQSAVDVTLQADTQSLNEVVVVGYGTQKRSDVTGSVASVPASRLSNLPVSNVAQAIQGAVAGVNITQTNTVPGNTSTINIRGLRSITANNNPYVVLDGVPFPGSFNDINPNDIQSIDILKDASAVAIYGTRGANGVILITTKRGATGKPQIRYSGYGGPEYMTHVLSPLDGPGYVAKYKAFTQQMGINPDPVPNYGELPNYQAGITTDWLKEIGQQGAITDHNLTISGGTQDVKYYISGEYFKQQGILKGYQYQRVNVRSNLDATLTSWLKIGTSLFYTNNNSDGGRVGLAMAMAMSPYGQEYNPDGSYKIYPMYPEALFVNPLLGLTNTRLERTNNMTGTFYAEVKPRFIPGLTYRINTNYAYIPYTTSSYSGRASNDLRGSAYIRNDETRNWTIENILTYNKDWDKHHVDVTALYSAQETKYFRSDINANGFINDQTQFYNIGSASTIGAPLSTYNRRGLLSQMGRINYSYDSRYLFTATARRDGSSVFGNNVSKYATFPSVAVGWNIANENFMKSAKLVTSLKLRASYGTTGNEAISPYGTITSLAVTPYVNGGLTSVGLSAATIGNANLKWESTTSANIGLDFGLFNNRFTGTIEYYDSKTSDLILSRRIPVISGYASILDNIGKVQNRGIELTLNSVNLKKGDFSWETNFNISANRNKILQLYGDNTDDIGNRWFIGKSLGANYNYQLVGVWQKGEDPSSQDPGAKPGDLKFADLNGDGKITTLDRTYLNNSLPKFIGGLTNIVKYKQFNLRIFLQGSQGAYKSNDFLNRIDYGGRINQPAAVGYWTAENMSNTRPALSYYNSRGYSYPSDASYLRVKDVTLSYALPQAVLDRLKMGALSVYVSGRNLATFTNWIGWDPEQNYAQTTDYTPTNYPNVATYVIGLNLSLR